MARFLFAQGYVASLDVELASGGHGVAGIDSQVHDDLFDLSGIGANWPKIFSGSEHKIDIFTDHAREHLQVFGGDIVEVDHPRSQHLLAAEGEQLAGQR